MVPGQLVRPVGITVGDQGVAEEVPRRTIPLLTEARDLVGRDVALLCMAPRAGTGDRPEDEEELPSEPADQPPRAGTFS